MALKETQIKEIEKVATEFLHSIRPPEEMRDKLDIGYRIEKNNIYIFETKPSWRDPKKIIESQIAKSTYVETEKHWKIFWMKSDMKWHSYSHIPSVKLISDFFNIVADDEMNCFFG